MSDDEVLAPDWRMWLAENLAEGVAPGEIVAVLAQHGVPEHEARARIAEILATPAHAVACAAIVRARRAELVLRLVRTRANVETIARRPALGADELFAGPWASGTPVVLTEVVTRWPAFTRWTPAYLRERFGEVEIEASTGREADPRYDIRFAHHAERMRFAAFVDRVLACERSNDSYLIANNHNLARTGLAPLLDDIVQPPYLDPARVIGSSALWFGPAGTITPLHHDTSSILLCQVRGTKRVWLVDPTEPALLACAEGVYSQLDVARVKRELPDVRVLELELAAGEALFLPAGWWHEIHALELSITIALNNFQRPNRHEWYKPGALV